MKVQRSLWAVLVLVIAGIGSALAHGGARVGVYFGPVWSPWYYPPPYYYYEPRVVVVPPSPPPVYIEQSDPAAPSGQQYWYYCKSAKGYYPYVKECPDGWQKVVPEPAR